MKFIELTTMENLKVIVNLQKVTEIYKIDNERGCSIFFGFGGSEEQAYISVKESYEQIKRML